MYFATIKLGQNLDILKLFGQLFETITVWPICWLDLVIGKFPALTTLDVHTKRQKKQTIRIRSVKGKNLLLSETWKFSVNISFFCFLGVSVTENAALVLGKERVMEHSITKQGYGIWHRDALSEDRGQFYLPARQDPGPVPLNNGIGVHLLPPLLHVPRLSRFPEIRKCQIKSGPCFLGMNLLLLCRSWLRVVCFLPVKPRKPRRSAEILSGPSDRSSTMTRINSSTRNRWRRSERIRVRRLWLSRECCFR